jgi:hypothetical protein
MATADTAGGQDGIGTQASGQEGQEVGIDVGTDTGRTHPRQLEPKGDNIFARPQARGGDDDDDDENLCSTAAERANRNECLRKECSGERGTASLCAKRCRYVHCAASSDGRDGRGCDTKSELRCKVDCFVERRCDDKKNGDKAEECRGDCRKECCGGDGKQEAKDTGDDGTSKEMEKEEEEEDTTSQGTDKGGAGSRDATPNAAAASASAQQGNGGIVQGAGTTTAIADEADDEDIGDDEMETFANDDGGGDTDADADADDADPRIPSGGDGAYEPVYFVFNLPVADEDLTAEDILTGADGNTVLEDLEGGLALLLPDLVEDAFGGNGGGEGKRKRKMLRNNRKMLVEYLSNEPPKITNVISAGEFV